MNPKVRSLANYCYDIKFAKPAKQDIANRMVKICQTEGFQKVESEVIEEITSRLGCDLR
jgi:replication factor C subunit 1